MVVEVTTRAPASAVMGRRGGALKVKVKAPPVEGKANKEVIKVVAAFLGVPPSNVRLARGAASRVKYLEVAGLTEAALAAALARAPVVGD